MSCLAPLKGNCNATGFKRHHMCASNFVKLDIVGHSHRVHFYLFCCEKPSQIFKYPDTVGQYVNSASRPGAATNRVCFLKTLNWNLFHQLWVTQVPEVEEWNEAHKWRILSTFHHKQISERNWEQSSYFYLQLHSTHSAGCHTCDKGVPHICWFSWY